MNLNNFCSLIVTIHSAAKNKIILRSQQLREKKLAVGSSAVAGELARTDCAWVTDLTAQHTAQHNNNTDKLKVVLTQNVFED